MAHVIDTSASDVPAVQDNLRTVSLAQKTELIGQIAGTVAHQFNNIMMAISSYAEVELKKASAPQKRSLEQVLNNAARATSLVQKLLAFSCKRIPSAQSLTLNGEINELRDLLEQLVGESIEVTQNLDPDIPSIQADPLELQQMILSLALHATHAKSRAGKLELSTQSIELDRAFIGNEDALPGWYVMLSIKIAESAASKQKARSASDSDQNLRAHLALTAVRQMVREAQGLIRVSSSPENGSSFRIYFPTQRQNRTQKQEEPMSKSFPQTKTILVVEDDNAVRVPATEFLMMEGFKVLQAKTGTEALEIVERHRSLLDLLITDIIMPEMSGQEVASQLLKKFPELKVLYMSGDAGKTPGPVGKGVATAVLQKPFRLNVLNERIHELLKD